MMKTFSLRFESVLTLRVICLIALLGGFLVSGRYLWQERDHPAVDYAVNWTAAYGLSHGLSAQIYDRLVMRDLSQHILMPQDAQGMFRVRFTDYIALPVLAMMHIPFTWLSYPLSLFVFRAGLFGGYVLAGVIASAALTYTDRALAFLIYCALLSITANGAAEAWTMGQTDSWVMLGLALSLWGTATATYSSRWYWVGFGIALATLIKVSPILIMVYLALRLKWRAFVAFLFAIALGCLILFFLDGGQSLGIFITQVAPDLGRSTNYMTNQSVAAYLARLASPAADLFQSDVTLGGWQYAGYALALLGMGAVWFVRPLKAEVEIAEIGLMIWLALLTAPLSWDHYFTWAFIGLFPFLRAELWEGWSGLRRYELILCFVIGAILIALQGLYIAPHEVAQNGAWRFVTGTKTLGLTLWFFTGWAMLRHRGRTA